jgi:hypothetical protein
MASVVKNESKFISTDTTKLQRASISEIMFSGSLPTMIQIVDGGGNLHILKVALLLHVQLWAVGIGVVWLGQKLPTSSHEVWHVMKCYMAIEPGQIIWNDISSQNYT